MRVGHRISTWGDKSHFPAVALYSSASSSCRVVVVDAVMIATQHRQIRRCGVSAIFVGIDMVYLAPLGGHAAVWPRAHEVFRSGQNPLLQRCKPRLVEIDGASRWVKQSGVEVLAKRSGQGGIDKLCSRHCGAI